MLTNQLSLTPDAFGIQFQRENYVKVAPAPSYRPTIYFKVFSTWWSGFSQDELTSLKAPILLATGDHDFVRLEHLLETFKLIPNAELAVIPDAGHFVLYGEQYKVLPSIEAFLDRTELKIPFATTKTGYHPGETR